MKKRLISLLLILCMVFTLFPTAVLAADAAEEPGETAAASQPAAPEETPNEPEDAGVPAAQEGESGTPASTTKVAKVNNTEYDTLESALNAARDGDTVTLLANCDKKVSISKKITLTANDNVTFSGSLSFASGSRGSKVEGVTFANTDPANGISNIIVLNASSITVQNCDFTVGKLTGVGQPNCIYVSTSGARIERNRFHVTRIADRTVVAVNLSGAGTDDTTVSNNSFDVCTGGDTAGSLFFFKAMGETLENYKTEDPSNYITSLKITNNRIDGSNAPEAVSFAGLAGVEYPEIKGNTVHDYFRDIFQVAWDDAGKLKSAKNKLDNTKICENSFSNQHGAAVAEIVKTRATYNTLAEAVNAANDGDTVKLLQNVTLSKTVYIGKNITIDGDYHTITTDGTPAVMFQITSTSGLDPVTIQNCTFVTHDSSEGNNTWVAIYVQNRVKNLTIKNNTFEIKALDKNNTFQCIGLAADKSNDQGIGGRYTGNIWITGNKVNDTHNENGNAFFVIAATGNTGWNNTAYSTVNLFITDNKLNGYPAKKLVGASVANVSNLTMTGNTFLHCYSGLNLLTGTNNGGQVAKANVLKDILTGNDDRGTAQYVLALSGSAPLVLENTPLWLPDVAYERIALLSSANGPFAKVGYAPGYDYEQKTGGKVPYPNDPEDPAYSLYGSLSGFVKTGETITLPEPKWEGHMFLGWTAEENKEAICNSALDTAGSTDAGAAQLLAAGATYTVTTSVKFVAHWADPIYVYFKPVNSENHDIKLDDAALTRLHLTYNSGAKDWFTYGRLLSTSTTLESAVPELKDSTKFERHDHNKDFVYGDQIEWTSLNMVNAGWHYGYSDKAAAYHLNGRLKFFTVTFDANAPTDENGTPLQVENMPANGYYCNGESLLVLKTPFCEGWTFAGWTFSEENFDGYVKGDLTVKANWVKGAADEDRIPVYAFFRAVDSAGNTIKLDDATRERLGNLIYNDTSNVWFTFGKLLTSEPLSETSYAKDSAAFKAVVAGLATPNFSRYDKNAAFAGAESIEWQDLKKVRCEHLGYDVTDEAYHLDGTLKFYNVTFVANAPEGATVENMPANGLYYDGESLAFINAPSCAGYQFTGWTFSDESFTGTVRSDLTVTAQWKAYQPVNTQVRLTIKCVTKDGTVLKTDVHTFDDPFAAYSIAAPEITGYTALTEKVEGRMSGQDTAIQIEYVRKITDGAMPILPPEVLKKPTPVKFNTADHFAYVNGYPDGTIKPTGNITRAEAAAILYRVMDKDSVKTYHSTVSGFRDVDSGKWYNLYVATLNKAGVITDSANGYFRPNDAITRAELAAMLAAFTDTTRAANYFNDVTANYWAANAIAVCSKLGWINGYPDGSFRPDATITRAEMMAMINRALERTPKSADDLLPGMKIWSDNTADKWYYLDVQEATNGHTYTKSGTRETWQRLTAGPNF